jgi:hypothetical protein
METKTSFEGDRLVRELAHITGDTDVRRILVAFHAYLGSANDFPKRSGRRGLQAWLVADIRALWAAHAAQVSAERGR